VLDGHDMDPVDQYVCQDLDSDTCDDCSVLGQPDTSDDGPDNELDGLCDAGDPDDDDDALPDTWEDSYACTDKWTADASDDDDSDGLTHAQEYATGTDPCSADTDSDGSGDAGDNCPTAYNPDQTNSDGHHKGDACDDDDDDDGWKDAVEVPGGGGAGPGDATGSNPLVIGSTPEVCDGADNDGNEGTDEGFPDTNEDGEADCHDDDFDADGDGIGNASDTNDDSWQAASTHNDMFVDTQENYMGTRRTVACWTAGNPVDADPFDFFKDGKCNVFDTMQYIPLLGSDVRKDDQAYDPRYDLFGPDGKVNVFDTMQFYVPPAAYGRACPYGK